MSSPRIAFLGAGDLASAIVRGPISTRSLAAADPRLAELTRGKLVLSVLAGRKLATLARTFPHARNLVRTMPNTPAAIGAGITPFCSQVVLMPGDHALVGRILGALGRYLPLDPGPGTCAPGAGGRPDRAGRGLADCSLRRGTWRRHGTRRRASDRPGNQYPISCNLESETFP